MTIVLVALIFINGHLHLRTLEHESKSACETAAAAIRATSPTATVFCAEVMGQST